MTVIFWCRSTLIRTGPSGGPYFTALSVSRFLHRLADHSRVDDGRAVIAVDGDRNTSCDFGSFLHLRRDVASRRKSASSSGVPASVARSIRSLTRAVSRSTSTTAPSMMAWCSSGRSLRETQRKPARIRSDVNGVRSSWLASATRRCCCSRPILKRSRYLMSVSELSDLVVAGDLNPS